MLFVDSNPFLEPQAAMHLIILHATANLLGARSWIPFMGQLPVQVDAHFKVGHIKVLTPVAPSLRRLPTCQIVMDCV